MNARAEADEQRRVAAEVRKRRESMDSLHSVPLSIMPSETPGVSKALMIKNAQLASAVELFRDSTAGSGQAPIPQLDGFFQDVDGALYRDIATLSSLAHLESFDVYSLRIELRRLDVGFENFDALRLSDSKRAELAGFMQTFTRPLIQRVFGDVEEDFNDVGDIIKMFTSPDREHAVKQLRKLASELDVEVSAIPEFLEKYGDIFLSLVPSQIRSTRASRQIRSSGSSSINPMPP
jgi:hypothetical protein